MGCACSCPASVASHGVRCGAVPLRSHGTRTLMMMMMVMMMMMMITLANTPLLTCAAVSARAENVSLYRFPNRAVPVLLAALAAHARAARALGGALGGRHPAA